MSTAVAEPAAQFVARLRKPVRIARPLVPSLVRGAVAGILAAALVVGGNFVFRNNLHEVQPGRAFRSAQMSSDQLRRVIADTGIRTVVNLRGCCWEFPWYVDECRGTHDAGISQEDVCLSAIRLPSPSEVRRLLEVLDRAEYPILLHCRQGVDRTGLAAVMVKLLEPGSDYAEARRQLSLPFGYVPLNGTENMGRFIDLYECWLRSIDCVHSPELFRHWVTECYCPGACRGTVAATADFPADRRLPPNTVRRLRVVAKNESVEDWRFRTGTAQGIHARYSVVSDAGQVVFSERAGLFDALVPPGSSIELTVGIPGLPPGRYALQIELCEGEGNAFCQFGNESFSWEFAVEP